MSTDSTPNESPPPESTSTEPGPSILTGADAPGDIRPLHRDPPVLGFVTAGSSTRYRNTNSRGPTRGTRALNWQLLVSGSFLAVFVLVFGLDALFEYVALPGG